MTAILKRTMLAALALAAALSLCVEAVAADSLFNMGFGGSSRKNSDQPTRIDADSMDIDLSSNVATLTGNVLVDDAEATIKCHKMIIYLDDAKAEASKEGAKGSKIEDQANPETSKKLKRVECIGDVIITRKAKKAVDANAAVPEQKALAGRADYDAVTGLIVLSEDPVVFHGKDVVKGKVISIDGNERIKILGGASLETSGSAGAASDSAGKR